MFTQQSVPHFKANRRRPSSKCHLPNQTNAVPLSVSPLRYNGSRSTTKRWWQGRKFPKLIPLRGRPARRWQLKSVDWISTNHPARMDTTPSFSSLSGTYRRREVASFLSPPSCDLALIVNYISKHLRVSPPPAGKWLLERKHKYNKKKVNTMSCTEQNVFHGNGFSLTDDGYENKRPLMMSDDRRTDWRGGDIRHRV